MICEFILVKGKNKGKNCKITGNQTLNNKLYCIRHYKLLQKNIIKEECKEEEIHIKEISKKFKIIKEIGKGEFGIVYKIEQRDTNKIYAVKINNNKKDLLYYEYLLLSQHFINNNAFPSLLSYPYISYKKNKDISYLITEYYEETLYERFERHDRNFSEEMIKKYIIQILYIIEFIHKKYYIYIDFKPENFMFKTKEDDNIKIIDFGLCEKFLDNKGVHKEDKLLSNRIGTDLYSSIRMMEAKQPGRIDDIECISYILLYLYYGKLSWAVLQKDTRILHQKKNIIKNKMFNKAPKYIQDFILLIKEYKRFDTKPNYKKLIEILT